MNMNQYTKVPDVIFDEWLPQLSEAELKIVLIIIRHTLGWHKQRDQISHSQFVRKTGLSQRAISSVVASLSEKELIKITNQEGKVLNAGERRHQRIIYYELGSPSAQSARAMENTSTVSRQNLQVTKDMYIQQKIENGVPKPIKQTDADRVDCIINRQRTGSCSCFRCT